MGEDINKKCPNETTSKRDGISCFTRFPVLKAVGFLLLIQVSVYLYFNRAGIVHNYFMKNMLLSHSHLAKSDLQHRNISAMLFSSTPGSSGKWNSTENEKKDKVIFYWNSFFASDWYVGFGHKPFESCEHKNCITTNDRQMYKDSDVMLCHMRSKGCGINDLPKYRTPNQYWIFFLMESPVNSASDDKLTPYNGVFNLTITYRRESNITETYSQRNKIVEHLKDKSYKFYKGKTASVAWIASNCWGASVIHGRMAYISELRKHITVERYGRCPGHTRCAKTCYINAAKRHKFYFAAENSICKDYITEKPWRALEVGMIPIVYGYGNYSLILPTHSYIDVNDFKSPRLLAIYLKKVADNETLYNEYFKWHDTYHQSASEISKFCRLCALLNQENRPKSIIYHLDKFWSETNHCVNPHKFHESAMQKL